MPSLSPPSDYGNCFGILLPFADYDQFHEMFRHTSARVPGCDASELSACSLYFVRDSIEESLLKEAQVQSTKTKARFYDGQLEMASIGQLAAFSYAEDVP